jgi:hypothetical protein
MTPPGQVSELSVSNDPGTAELPVGVLEPVANEGYNELPTVAEAADKVQETIQAATADGPNGNKSHDEEVAAALASLAPSNGHSSSSAVEIPVTMAAAVAAETYSGPRWIATEVALSDDESSLILDQEMHKAFAAFAAADAARMSSPVEQRAPEAPEPPQSAVAIEAEPKADTLAASSVVNQEQSSGPSAPAETPAAESNPEETEARAAYAAAASASTSTAVAEGSTQTIPSPEVTPEAVPQPQPQHDSELASAWASWKQVRDSVSSPEFTSQVADVATTGFKEIRHEEPPTRPEHEAAAEDNDAIAGIVDSVLAELKPKLMQEIAKKMKKEK